MKSKQNSAIMFLGGGILGAALALIYAPQSGRKTRRDIRLLGEKAKSKAESLRKELRESIDVLTVDVAERLEKELDRGRELSEKTIRDVRNAIESGRKLIGQELDKLGLG